MDPIEATARILHRVLQEGSAADEDEFAARFKKHAEALQEEVSAPKPSGDPPMPGAEGQ